MVQKLNQIKNLIFSKCYQESMIDNFDTSPFRESTMASCSSKILQKDKLGN
jgi:hypothetical protein